MVISNRVGLNRSKYETTNKIFESVLTKSVRNSNSVDEASFGFQRSSSDFVFGREKPVLPYLGLV